MDMLYANFPKGIQYSKEAILEKGDIIISESFLPMTRLRIALMSIINTPSINPERNILLMT